MERPDLTYLTQAEFYIDKDFGRYIFDNDNIIVLVGDNENGKYFNPISKLPELVQCAEMLFDMTLLQPDSLVHKFVSDLLNELKEDNPQSLK